MTALFDAATAAGLAALATILIAPLIAFVAGLAARLAPGPRAKEAVWTLALVLCAAPTLLAPVAAPHLGGVRPIAFQTPVAAAPERVPLLVRTDGSAPDADEAGEPASAPPPLDKAVKSVSLSINVRVLGVFGAGALAAGFAIGGLIAVRRRRRLADIMRETAALDDEALRLEVARRSRVLGVTVPPHLRRTPRPAPPFAHPGPPPAIVLPDTLLDAAAHADVAMVCGHELAHLKRRDHLRRALERTVASLFWFAPGVGFIAARLDDAREAVCDAIALETGAVTPRAYARTLLAACRRASSPVPAGALAFISFGRRRNSMRFNLLLHPRPRAARLRSVAAVALLAALGGGIAASGGALAAAYAGPGDAEHAAQEARTLANIRIARVRADDDTATYEITRLGDAPEIAETRRGGVMIVDYDLDGVPARLRIDDGGGMSTFTTELRVERDRNAYRAEFYGDSHARLTLSSGRGHLTAQAGGDGTRLDVTLVPGGNLAELDIDPPAAPVVAFASSASPSPAVGYAERATIVRPAPGEPVPAGAYTEPTPPTAAAFEEPETPEGAYVEPADPGPEAYVEPAAPAALAYATPASAPEAFAEPDEPSAAAFAEPAPAPAIAAFGANTTYAVSGAFGPPPDFTSAVITSGEARITSGFGERLLDGEPVFHQGVDVGAPIGTPVRAPAHGVIREIRRAGENGNAYGHMIVVDHGNGWRARYTNLSRIDVKLNHKVFPGDVLGAVGDSSASSKGPHLHMELWNRDALVDPMPYVHVIAED